MNDHWNDVIRMYGGDATLLFFVLNLFDSILIYNYNLASSLVVENVDFDEHGTSEQCL